MKKLLKVKQRERNRKLLVIIIVMLLFSASIYSFIYVDSKIKPTVQAVAQAKAQQMANQAINNAVGEILKDKIKYEELINLKSDKDGNVTMVQAKSICTKLIKISTIC